jgi:hypothetical protein
MEMAGTWFRALLLFKRLSRAPLFCIIRYLQISDGQSNQ